MMIAYYLLIHFTKHLIMSDTTEEEIIFPSALHTVNN